VRAGTHIIRSGSSGHATNRIEDVAVRASGERRAGRRSTHGILSLALGRDDEYLRLVRQPTLLIVGALDTVVIELNRKAMQELSGEARLEIVAGASHLFEEPGALEQVAQRAQGWFSQHLKPGSRECHPGGTSSSARPW
jgi:pimeloyl-ACP methyl ester carboxylesterase